MLYKKIIPPEKITLCDSMLLEGNAVELLRLLPSNSIQCVVTAPPCWGVRDYGIDGQIGRENLVQQFINNLVKVFSEVKRVLREDGTFWLNMGDRYTVEDRPRDFGQTHENVFGWQKNFKMPERIKSKELLGIPWRLAFALQDDGWYLRSDIIWNKPNVMPEGVKDRPTKSHEYLFMLTKSKNYFYNQEAAKEIGLNGSYRNRRTVWNINTQPYQQARFPIMPSKLVEICILLSSSPEEFVLDPFFGSGTVGLVCIEQERQYVGIELNPEYVGIAANRLRIAENNIIKYSVWSSISWWC
jgi:site-specific DNA-methyltransferase (adenine-specific)